MISVTSLLWIWKGESTAGRWYFLTIPEEQSAELRAEALASRRGFGSVRVECRIGAVAWRTSVFPLDGGGYLLPVKATIRRDTGISVGDEVSVKLNLI